MKVVLSLFLVMAATVSAKSRLSPGGDIAGDSPLGMAILKKARRANDANSYISYYENGQTAGYYSGNTGSGASSNYDLQWLYWSDYMIAGSSWLQHYAIKFQGCYDTLKWNDDAQDANDVRLVNKHIVRFRLCPVNMCAPGYDNGCSSDYGDYVVDLETYLQAYVEAKEAYDDWYDQVQQDQQQNQNMNNAYGYYYDQNFQVENYLACTASNIKMDADDYYGNVYKYNNNNQNNNNQNNNNNNNAYYYIGPYCSEQGGAIHMGLFTDDQCTVAADGEGGKLTYMEKTGTYLPFADRSMIEYDCFSCEEPSGAYAQYNGAGNDGDDEDAIADFCEVAYIRSGKCETKLPSSYFNMYKQKNTKSCNYIEGIKMIRDDGTILTTQKLSPGHLNSQRAGMFFVGFFGLTFLGLSCYVYHLKRKFAARNDIVLD